MSLFAHARLFVSFFAALVLSPACGSTDMPTPSGGADAGPSGDGGTTGPDAAPAEPCTEDGSAEIAVVAAVNNFDDYDKGYVQIYALNGTGRLRDTGIKVGEFRIPQAIDMRSDGEEVVVTWGTSQPDDKHGFTIIRVQNGGGSAEVLQQTELPGQFGPLRVAYVDDDTIIVGRVGPGTDDLVPLRRQGDGKFAAGTPLPVPGEYPQDTRPMANVAGKSFFLQSSLGTESKLYVLDHSGDSLMLEDNPIDYPDGPMFFYSNPRVARAYMPEANPDDPGCDGCNPTGIVHDVSVGATGIKVHDDFLVANRASLAAVNRDGDTLYLVDHVAGGPSRWDIFGVSLNAEGAPVSATNTLFSVDGPWVFQLLVSPRGHVLASVERDDYGIAVHTRDGSGNFVECQNDVVLPGNVELAISSWPALD